MRPPLAATLFCGLLAGGSLPAAQPEFPYKAYVCSPDVYVRSGPGEDYYPTDKLKLGQEVEIYRHDPGGWYAIRPPAGSFSWVSSRYLDMQKDRIAAVNGDRVAARVGTRFSAMRDVIQVRLEKSELVEVLDAEPAEKGWTRIAPPAGEFRWIYGRYVDRDFPHDGIQKRHEVHPASDSVLGRPDDPPQHHGHTPPPPRPATESAEPAPAGSLAVTAPMRQLSPEEFKNEIEELELDLAVMVAEEPTVWTFEKIGPRARALAEQAQTAVERGYARQLMSKVARFEEIKQRYDAVDDLRRDVDRRNTQLADLSRRRGDSIRVAAQEARFDGTGKLSRLSATEPGAPRYALVDPDGSVRCYVTPAPGVNLQNYVGREVGVHGVRGFMPEQKAQHIVAKHVAALEETKVR